MALVQRKYNLSKNAPYEILIYKILFVVAWLSVPMDEFTKIASFTILHY